MILRSRCFSGKQHKWAGKRTTTKESDRYLVLTAMFLKTQVFRSVTHCRFVQYITNVSKDRGTFAFAIKQSEMATILPHARSCLLEPSTKEFVNHTACYWHYIRNHSYYIWTSSGSFPIPFTCNTAKNASGQGPYSCGLDGRVVQPPRAAESSGRQNEYFKWGEKKNLCSTNFKKLDKITVNSINNVLSS